MTGARYAVEVLIESAAADAASLNADQLADLLRYALAAEGAPAASLTLLVMDDPGIQQLHRDFLNDDTPTDVLSFTAASEAAFPMEPGAGRYLGDIAVSWDTAAAQGPDAGMTVADEVAFLALHGLLHLLGMDDATDDERAAMHARQHTLLDAYHARDAD